MQPRNKAMISHNINGYRKHDDETTTGFHATRSDAECEFVELKKAAKKPKAKAKDA